MTDDGESTIRRLNLNDIRDVIKEIAVAISRAADRGRTYPSCPTL
jgi:hypothetical protein